MKTREGMIIGSALLIVVAISLPAATPDELHWWWASSRDKAQNYGRYLSAWPGGRHAAEAKRYCDERTWADALAAHTVEAYRHYEHTQPNGAHIAEARAYMEDLVWRQSRYANTVGGFETYLESYPNGRFAAEARWRIEEKTWQAAKDTGTLRSLRAYLDAYPQGRFGTEAQAKHAALRVDERLFTAALQPGTEGALETLLTEFAGHVKEAEAQQILQDMREGRDIVDLLNEEKIEIETQGNGIQRVNLRVRRLVPYPCTLRVPVGTYLVSANQSSQNMVTTAECKVRLADDGWQSLAPSAACANRPRDIPDGRDTFRVERSPHQAELAKVVPLLDKEGMNYATRQAAVWIVTDDASYSELGILVSRPAFQAFGSTRTIREAETVRAMKICDEAGIDITRKRIWNDREMILRGLNDAALKAWLEQRD